MVSQLLFPCECIIPSYKWSLLQVLFWIFGFFLNIELSAPSWINALSQMSTQSQISTLPWGTKVGVPVAKSNHYVIHKFLFFVVVEEKYLPLLKHFLAYFGHVLSIRWAKSLSLHVNLPWNYGKSLVKPYQWLKFWMKILMITCLSFRILWWYPISNRINNKKFVKLHVHAIM